MDLKACVVSVLEQVPVWLVILLGSSQPSVQDENEKFLIQSKVPSAINLRLSLIVYLGSHPVLP